jgi:hypothetical protein
MADNPFSLENTYARPETAPPPMSPATRDSNPFALENLYPPDEQSVATSTEPTPEYRGTVLPFTRYSDQSVHFEPFASGVIGSVLGYGRDTVEAAKKAATLPGRVLSGEAQMPPLGFDPSDPRSQAMAGEGLNFASMFGPNINPMVRSGDYAIAGAGRRAPDMSLAVAPSSQELKNVGGGQLNAVRELPVKYDPNYMPVLADRIEQDLIKKGIFPENSPNLYSTIGRLRDVTPPAGQTVHLEPANLMAMRENLAGHFESGNENKAGVGIAFKHLNDFIENPPPEAVLAGPAADVGALYAKGRANYGAGLRGEDLADIRRTADFRAAAANSGQNIDNSIRSRVASAVLNASKMRGYTPEEAAALEAVPLGSTGNNLLRWTGNFLGGGGGLGSVVTGGVAGTAANYLGAGPGMTSAVAASIPAVGKYLKAKAGEGTAEALQRVENMTRQRSPLFREQVGGQDLISDTPWRNALARTILNRTIAAPSSLPPGTRSEDYL